MGHLSSCEDMLFSQVMCKMLFSNYLHSGIPRLKMLRGLFTLTSNASYLDNDSGQKWSNGYIVAVTAFLIDLRHKPDYEQAAINYLSEGACIFVKVGSLSRGLYALD